MEKVSYFQSSGKWSYFKTTVMPIEKALINDSLRVSKLSWKVCIPTML